MEEDLESAAEQLLQYIQDRDNFSADGFLRQLGLLGPEVTDGLFLRDANGITSLQSAKELLPVACETGDLETVVWLLFLGADPSVQGQRGSSLEIATLHGHAEIVNKLILWNEGALESRDTVVGCLVKACEGQHEHLAKFWLGHVNNLRLHQKPWSHFMRKNGVLQNGYAVRVPEHCIQQISEELIQVLGQTMQLLLEVLVSSDEEDESDQERLYGRWNNRRLPSFDETWLQRPKYNTHLVHVNLSQNDLKAIPEILLWGIPFLEFLDLSNNKITELPDPGGTDPDQSGLIFLKVTRNSLTTISNDIFMMQHLEMLSLARNKITSIGDIEQDDEDALEWKCKSLQDLNLSFNELTSLPETISVASRLKRLELSNNHLTEMTNPWHCPLEILDLSHNQISEVPDIHVYWRHSLRILNLSSNNLGEIPNTICQLTMLENLNLRDTGIQRLPDKDEWKTFYLAKLDLSSNQLVQSAGRKTIVTRQYVKPEDQLSFPDYFGNILKGLNLSHNDLYEVPNFVCQMRRLQYLDIEGNPSITCLPDQIAALRHLEKLRFDPDRIRHPSELSRLLRQTSQSSGTDKTNPVKQTLRKRLLRYEACREMKLILVGPSQAGKTELLCSLTGYDWPQSDLGVNVISKTSLNIKDNMDIEFTMWDLKGSDDFIVIHQAFLTPHAIYLLVWDMTRRDDESMKRLEHHVLNIKARAPTSPIIAVGTHIDRYKHNRQEVVTESIATFARKFPDTDFTFVEVDARPVSSDGGIKDLKRWIINHATTMTCTNHSRRYLMLGREVPKSFADLKEHLSHVQEGVLVDYKPFLTEAELAATIQQMPNNFIETTTEVEDVVQYLQDCGALIHIQDYTYKLTRLYFLDPVWLSNTLVEVVRLKNNDMTENQGVVTESQLRRLAKQAGFAEHNFKEYLQLLARFEIVLSTIKSCPESHTPVNEPRKYIIPSALPHGRPWIETIGDNPYKNKLMRWYRMAYTPPGFWSRLVARLLVSIKQQDLKQFRVQLEHILPCVSQEGLFIRHDDGEIKIEPLQIFQDTSLSITLLSKDNVFSPLGFIVDHIEKLIKEWYPGLTKNRLDGRPRVVRYIPCPVCVQNFQSNASEERRQKIPEHQRYHLFSLEELTRTTCINRQEFVVCPKHPKDTVSTATLAPDLFLTDLAVEHLNDDELLVDPERIDKGSFGEVYVAQYRGQQVAVKTLLRRWLEDLHQSQTSPSPSSTTSSTLLVGHEAEQPVENMPSTTASLTSSESESGSGIQTALHSVMGAFPRLRYEVRMMAKLNHPCALKLVGVSVPRMAFAMELVPDGDLASYISVVYKQRIRDFVVGAVVHDSVLPRLLSFKIAFQVASVIRYLHGEGIIHADIKTNNVLLLSTDIRSPINIKLADYGLSKDMDVAGVRGDVGRNVFCAPEIIKGLAFDEKVDWFSYAMLLYHLISGRPPFQQATYVATVSQLTGGARPNFKYFNYSMRPQLPNMESLMKECWSENPDERPIGKAVVETMQNLSFMCLRRCMALPGKPSDVLYINSDDQDNADGKYRVYIWKPDGQVKERDISTGDIRGKVIKIANQEETSRVLCACAFERTHVVGTSRLFIETYNVVADKLVLCNQIRVSSEVSSLYYHKTTEKHGTILIPEQTSGNKYGILFVGFNDGKIAMFKHETAKDEPVSTWIHRKTLTISDEPLPCRYITPVMDRNEIWFSCGNILRVFKLSDGLFDPVTIQVSPRNEVKGLCYTNGSIWCFVQNSDEVVRYDAATRTLTSAFHCSNRRPGDYLTQSIKQVPPNGSHSSNGTAEAANAYPASQDQNLPVVVDDERAKVTAILIVEDTIWIGRSHGGILVVYIGKEKEDKFGEVLGVFEGQIPTTRPTSQLLQVGSDRVLECQDVDNLDGKFTQHLLLWEKWGRQEIDQSKYVTVISRSTSSQRRQSQA